MPLDKPQLLDASRKALKNAHELVEEATILHQNKRWPRVVFLSQIAGEELGKCFISLTAIGRILADRFDERRYLRRFRNHAEKTGSVDFFETLIFSDDEPAMMLKKRKENIPRFERIKLASLYTDFENGIAAVLPSEIVREEFATGVLQVAKNRLRLFDVAVKPLLDGDYVLRIDRDSFLRAQKPLKTMLGKLADGNDA